MRAPWLRALPCALWTCFVAAAAALPVHAAPKAYVGNFKDNTVSVIDVATGTLVASVPVAAGPHGMSISADGGTVYVGGDGSSSVDVIDTVTDSVVRSIDVGKAPHGLALVPDGSVLLAAVYGEDAIAFVDLARSAVTAKVAVAKPHTIAIRPDGKVAYVASQEPGKFALVVVDLERRSVARTIALDKPPRDLEFGFDGERLYITQAGVDAVQVLDPASDRIVASIATGVSPHIAGWYRGAPAGTAVVQGPGQLVLFDPARNAVLRTVNVGRQPHWMAPFDAGAKTIVTNEGSNDVTIVDLASGDTKTIAVGNAPRKVVVQPAKAQTTAAEAASKVSIRNFQFEPATLTVPVGASVAWSNDDGAPHGLAYKDGAVGTDVLLPGKAFMRTFQSAGTFEYFCAVHPYMTGKVVVQAK
jgi:YVTN family beta-propeller protein